jgi:septation ring formation regulator EzrA
MKHQPHFERANDVGLREAARIGILIADLERTVRILDCDVASEEQCTGVSDPTDAAYPMLARTLAARRDNLKETIAALEKRLAGLQDRTEQIAA